MPIMIFKKNQQNRLDLKKEEIVKLCLKSRRINIQIL